MTKINELRDEVNHLSQAVKQLEKRVRTLESFQSEQTSIEESEVRTLFPTNINEVTEKLELRIGQFWFAKTGIVILAMGIAFLLTFQYKNLPPFLPSMMGYILVVFILLLSYFWKNSYSYLSRYLMGGGLVLLYFSTLRLHHFSDKEFLHSHPILISLLLISVVITFAAGLIRKSPYLTGLATTLGFITAIVSNHAYVIFFILLTQTVTLSYLKIKYNWNGLIVYGILTTYFVHFLWFINNPLMGNSPQLMTGPTINLLFLLMYMVGFASSNLFRKRGTAEDGFIVFSTLINCLAGFGLFLLITLTRYSDLLFVSHFFASVIFLGLSIIFWAREKSKYSTFFYAILGYSALSVAIVAQFNVVGSFIYLCWQSLLVISTALWYRSKIIVVANFIIFLIIFLGYLGLTRSVGIESLSFGIIALLSARIMNWQKHRLELKTEFMRNAYLTTAFFMIPYSFYHSFPEKYVAISWVGIALFYYGLNIILHNKKYRWMASLTLLLTVIYILIVGVAKLEPVYRIISFIILGVVLLTMSIIYTKIKKKKEADETPAI